MKNVCLIYIGYLTGYRYSDPILLCVSDEKIKVKYYLKNVRNLSNKEYDIREVVLDFDTAMILYEDYVLQDFEKDCLFLTNRDIEYLNTEIQTTIQQLEISYDNLKRYCEIVRKVPSMKDSLNTLYSSLKIMEKQLSKVKTLRKLCNADIKDSPIFSRNILEYLKYMDILQEDKELTEMFYRKVCDENE